MADKTYLTREEIQALRDYKKETGMAPDLSTQETMLLLDMAEAYLGACERVIELSEQMVQIASAVKDKAPETAQMALAIGAQALTVVYGSVPKPEDCPKKDPQP